MTQSTIKSEESNPPSLHIIKQWKEVNESLPFDDTQDFVNAKRGWRGSLGDPNQVIDAQGNVVWNNDAYDFLKDDAPYSANPSLWRQSQLTRMNGLYHVAGPIYQVRGLDLSNTTIIEGDEGIIVIDPLTSQETGAAALALYQKHRGTDRAVKAVIYTHSHVDHFGGVKGFVSEDDVEKNDIKIIAPEGFLEHAVSENVYTGTSMSRRAAYMYGAALEQGPRGQIGAGLGQTTSTGVVTLIAPNMTVRRTGEKRTVDGIKMEFQMAPDTEAPSEMLIWFPDLNALCAAEDATHTFHNILTLRGAVVRDPHSWAKYLTETIDRYGSQAEVVFAQHHWPTWGNDNILKFLTYQRDLYAYAHDQTLRLLNKGYNGPEIAEMLTLPPALDQSWYCRGYYGSLSHNVKAIYQRYVGWFDGNPAHLWEHTPVDKANRYVDLIGEDKVLEEGTKAYLKGDYRWAAELLNHAVFNNPNNEEACKKLADVYEQLGYGSENGTWRNFYISGTTELRNGNFGTPTQTAAADVLGQLTPDMVLDTLAIKINGPEAWDKKVLIDLVVSDQDNKTYHSWLSNGALVYSTADQSNAAQVTLTGTAKQLTALAVYGPDPDALVNAGIVIDGDTTALDTLASLLDPGDPNFSIVKP
ncbi:beta-lactamase domain protein [Aspergillus costaricaensis CBS 115574]|uniref:Beta-lactamase domain protein n=1 Tax=Aspergillus costaricaensis CBS 115574 TaxID=1448317 RepID=A0ACD1I4U7_9EURO|nr:beta-lactamase domain protein [Aspergillus costaricaensis CBS 115574]RAK85505.1 beta-lactamase domain protein [Aspergillus costaricaensis CBS 115574]